MAVEQIPLVLSPREPLAADYFVVHSGVGQAVGFFQEAIERLLSSPDSFHPIYIFGASGTGKSHLLQVVRDMADRAGISPQLITLLEVMPAQVDDEWVASAVSAYELQKRLGGLFIISARVAYEKLTDNPHLLSRIRGGMILELRHPPIEELRPTLLSLLERKNLRLSERAIEYLLRRVPSNPLSLWAILAKIDDRALREGRQVGLQIIREILG